MLIIRLQRTGKRNSADFRVVLAQKTAHVSKKVTEILGSYNPKTKDLKIKNPERLKYWIAQQIELSPTVHNLLVTKGMHDAPKVRAFNTPKKEVAKDAAPAAPAAEAVAAPQAEEPAVETPAESPAEEPMVEAPAETPAA